MLVTVHNSFKNPVLSSSLTDEKIDDTMSAWKYIFAHWHSSVWIPIPDFVRAKIKFHPQLGMCGGNLVTKIGANGMQSYINRQNNRSK